MVFRFGTFAFDDRTGLLTRGDRPVALEPQPARALALLLTRAGDVVSRDELRAHLWSGDTHVDFDRGLAYCVGQLRAALGDSADNPRFVQTLPRRGFKFLAPVEAVPAAGLSSAEVARAAPADNAPAFISGPMPRFGLTEGFTLAGLAAAAAVGLVFIAAPLFLNLGRSTFAPGRPIVAVALFENESGDPSHERAVAALADVIVERLTALGTARLGVNGNASILRRPRDARDPRAVAQETGAAFLVAGQLQEKDGHLSLLVHLIRLEDGTHVWVNRIARPAGDRLEALDTEVAQQVESAVRRFVLDKTHASHNAAAPRRSLVTSLPLAHVETTPPSFSADSPQRAHKMAPRR
jgi:DNA-binding winged helix-turn-helix (wHTH) protein/TolB-like protein